MRINQRAAIIIIFFLHEFGVSAVQKQQHVRRQFLAEVFHLLARRHQRVHDFRLRLAARLNAVERRVENGAQL